MFFRKFHTKLHYFSPTNSGIKLLIKIVNVLKITLLKLKIIYSNPYVALIDEYFNREVVSGISKVREDNRCADVLA